VYGSDESLLGIFTETDYIKVRIPVRYFVRCSCDVYHALLPPPPPPIAHPAFTTYSSPQLAPRVPQRNSRQTSWYPPSRIT
jgi:hypothetical protein